MVAENDGFIAFANLIGEIAFNKNPNDVDALKALPYKNEITVSDKLMEEIGRIWEKIDILYYETISGAKVFPYNYNGNRLASVVAFSKNANEDVMKSFAMQVAAMAPVAVDEDLIDGKTIEIEVNPGEKIIDALLRKNYNPPFSCSSGACATCIAKLVSGKVKMDVSMALEANEIEAGYILTCQSRALTEEVEIVFE